MKLTTEQFREGIEKAKLFNEKCGLPNKIPLLEFDTTYDPWEEDCSGLGLFFEVLTHTEFEFKFYGKYYNSLGEPRIHKEINKSFKILKLMLYLGKSIKYVNIRLWRVYDT